MHATPDGSYFGLEKERMETYFQDKLRKVKEGEAEFALAAEVPGFTEKELDIRVEPKRIVITGKTEASLRMSPPGAFDDSPSTGTWTQTAIRDLPSGS